MLIITAHGIHPHVIPVLVEQLESFGATIHENEGLVITPAGEMRFDYNLTASTLTIRVTKDHGHFPLSMLIGGIKQIVEEAAERFNCSLVFEVSRGESGP